MRKNRANFKITKEQVYEIEQEMVRTKDSKVYKRLQAVMLRGKGKTINEICEITGYSFSTVSILSKKYLNDGISALVSDKRTSNNYYLTESEEEAFLEQFKEAAQKGQVITVKEMHIAYQKRIGKETPIRSFYDLLKRHGWRKIMPRPKYPKAADAETIDVSKKLTPKSKAK